MNEIWILGATGRSGRAVAAKLAAADAPLVLVGRDAQRLDELAVTLGGKARVVTAGSVEAMATAIRGGKPGVVVNTVGPFAETAVPLAKAGPPGTHYLDLSNELASFIDLFALHNEASVAGSTLVTGVGFGVLATESVVLKLCEGRPAPASVRVDAMAVLATEPGAMGHALAATIVGATAGGGWRYAVGKLVRAPMLTELETLTAPDSSVIKTITGPTGDLIAAQRASGAQAVVGASSLMPTAPLVCTLMRTIVPIMKIPAFRDLAIRRLAAVQFKATAMSREFSWGHARVEWGGGEVREGWLRSGDAMDFTTATVVEVTTRLARGEGRPGAYTPGELFGADLAISAGGEFFLPTK